MAKTKATGGKQVPAINHSRKVARSTRDASPVRTPEEATSAPSSPVPTEEVSDAELDALLAMHATSANYEAIATLVFKCCAVETTTQEIIGRLQYTLKPTVNSSLTMDWQPRNLLFKSIRTRLRASLRLLSQFCETSLQTDLELAEQACVIYGAQEHQYLTYNNALPFPNLYLFKWNGPCPGLFIPKEVFENSSIMGLIAAHHQYLLENAPGNADFRFLYPCTLVKYAAERAGMPTSNQIYMSSDDLFLECHHNLGESECYHLLSLEGLHEGLHCAETECPSATWPDDEPKHLTRRKGMLVFASVPP